MTARLNPIEQAAFAKRFAELQALTPQDRLDAQLRPPAEPMYTGHVPTPSLAEAMSRLSKAGVFGVYVGGVAAAAHGVPVDKFWPGMADRHGYVGEVGDLDMVVDVDPLNLDRLTSALNELKMTHWTVPNWPQGIGPAKSDQFDKNISRYGNDILMIDIFRSSTDGFDYSRLQANASLVDFHGDRIAVASIDDLIAIRDAASQLTDAAPGRRDKERYGLARLVEAKSLLPELNAGAELSQ